MSGTEPAIYIGVYSHEDVEACTAGSKIDEARCLAWQEDDSEFKANVAPSLRSGMFPH